MKDGTAIPATYNVFPIPLTALQANPNLTQKPWLLIIKNIKMKKILKISALFLMVAATFSCEEDEIPTANMISPQNGPVIIAPMANQCGLDPDAMDNLALTLAWDDAAYSVQTPITYTVEFAEAGTNFEAPFTVATTTARAVSWSVEQLNGIAINPDGLALLPYVAQEVDVRIVSGVGGGSSQTMASNAITLTITPYTTDNPLLAVPENHQGWSPPTAPLIASSGYGETDYEGYMWLDGSFKFLSPQPDGTFDWGTYTGLIMVILPEFWLMEPEKPTVRLLQDMTM